MRLINWQERFSEFAAARWQLAFAWGSNDCCLFAADAVLALTGEDPAVDLRGTYDDAAGATRLVQARGGLSAIATAALGEPVTPLMAGAGDIVLLTNEGRDLLGVCNGVNAIAPGPLGIAVVGMDAATAAWKV